MELWDWLKPWWYWWADLTDLFFWPAISAAVAGLAWWRTGTLADRANRDARAKNAVFILATRELFYDFRDALGDPVNDYKSYYVTSVKRRGHGDVVVKTYQYEIARNWSALIQDVWERERLLEQVKSVKLTEFPSIESFRLFSLAHLYMIDLAEMLVEFKGDDGEIDKIADLAETLDGVIDQMAEGARRMAPHAVQSLDRVPLLEQFWRQIRSWAAKFVGGFRPVEPV